MNDNNYLTTLDENNKPMINPAYYKNVIIDYIELYRHDNDIPRNKLTGNDLLSVFLTIQENIFKPTTTLKDNKQCNIPYTENNITLLWDIYRNISVSYKIPPSLYAFSILTGIQEQTAMKYVTPSRIETTNIRREMLRNELYNDRMGRIVLANNDTSYGLEYEKKNTVEREQIRQGLALSDLPQIQ